MLNARCGSATVSAVKTGDHPPDAANEPEPITIHAGMTLKQAEQLLIEATLRHTAGNVKQAARMLGLDRSTVSEKLKRYGIKRQTRPE